MKLINQEFQDIFGHLQLGDGWKSRTGRGVNIAVIDSGIDANHPLLQGKVSESVEAVVEAAGTEIPGSARSYRIVLGAQHVTNHHGGQPLEKHQRDKQPIRAHPAPSLMGFRQGRGPRRKA